SQSCAISRQVCRKTVVICEEAKFALCSFRARLRSFRVRNCPKIHRPPLARAWSCISRAMTDYFAYPGVREWWATRKHWLTDEFRAVVEAIIAKKPEQKLYAAYNLYKSSKT